MIDGHLNSAFTENYKKIPSVVSLKKFKTAKNEK